MTLAQSSTVPSRRSATKLGPIAVALDAPRNDSLHDPPGGDHAGGYTVDGDPERPEILSEIPRVVGDGGFRRPIMGIAAISGRCGPGDRAYGDDLPGALLLHHRGHGVAG